MRYGNYWRVDSSWRWRRVWWEFKPIAIETPSREIKRIDCDELGTSARRRGGGGWRGEIQTCLRRRNRLERQDERRKRDETGGKHDDCEQKNSKRGIINSSASNKRRLIRKLRAAINLVLYSLLLLFSGVSEKTARRSIKKLVKMRLVKHKEKLQLRSKEWVMKIWLLKKMKNISY